MTDSQLINYSKIWIWGITACLFLLYASPTMAHGYETSGPFSVLMHAEPGDKPVAGGKSIVNFFLSDRDKTFDATKCDCRIAISLEGKKVSEQAIFTEPNNPADGNAISSINYIFNERGVYFVELIGVPKDGAKFSPFKVHFTQRVELSFNIFGGLSTTVKIGLSVLAVGIGLAGFGLYAMLRLKLRRAASINSG